jgi:hypothetical protein
MGILEPAKDYAQAGQRSVKCIGTTVFLFERYESRIQ